MSLTLGDLLDQREFGLELCTGGDDARALPVDGVHCIDHKDAARWLDERWVMMATGAYWLRTAAAQRLLVNELVEADVTALGLALGVGLDEIPGPLIEEAERKGFPVFSIPLRTPFREIVLYVTRSALSADLHALQRLSGMQRYLLDALHDTSPESALVERLGSLLDSADVCYFDRNGEPIAATTPGLRWPETPLEAGRSGIQEFEHHGRPGISVTVLNGDRPTGTLAVMLRPRTISPGPARQIVRTASELLGLVSVTRQAASRDRDSHRERLGARVLRFLSGEVDRALPSQLAEAGIDFVAPCAVVSAAPHPREGASPISEAVTAVTEAIDAAGLDVVIATAESGVDFLVQGDLGSFDARLLDEPRLGPLCVGISEPVPRFKAIGEGFEQARLALGAALSDWRTSVRRYADLDPSATLIATTATPETIARLEAILEPLDEEPRLREAVVAYLDTGFDLGRTANLLHLHRNSARHRLTRAEEVLGRSLRSPETVTALHLALQAQSRRRVVDGAAR